MIYIVVTGTTEGPTDMSTESEDILTATDRPLLNSGVNRSNTLPAENSLGLSTPLVPVNNTSNNPPTDSTSTLPSTISLQNLNTGTTHNINGGVTNIATLGQTSPNKTQNVVDIMIPTASTESGQENVSQKENQTSEGIIPTLSTASGGGVVPISDEVPRTVLINGTMASKMKAPTAETRTGKTAIRKMGKAANISVSQAPATVTYKAGSPSNIDNPSLEASTTVSSMIATEIHIKLQETQSAKLSPSSPSSSSSPSPSSSTTSSLPNASTSHTSSQHYVPSLEDDEDYAQASGEGDDDITIDDVFEERPRGGNHYHDYVDHKHHNGGHHGGGGHHHKKGHHKNGATHEVPYRYIPARREVRERLVVTLQYTMNTTLKAPSS